MTILRFISLPILCAGCMLWGASAEAGPPSPSSPWTKREYVDFYFSHYNGNQALPHLREPAMSVLFERVIDRENVARIVGSAETVEDKRRHIAMILMTMGEIRAAYNYAVLVGEPLQEELTRVQAFTLYVLDAAVRLSEGDTIDSRRKDSFRTTLFGVVHSLSERSIYSNEQLALLTSALTNHYPTISASLADIDRRDFQTRIGKLLTDEADPGVRAALAGLMSVAEGIAIR